MSCRGGCMTIWRLVMFSKLIQDINVLLHFVKSVLIWSTCCWKAIGIALLWVVVLTNYELLYCQSYDPLKVGWVLKVDWPPPIVKVEDAQHHVQLLATFSFINNPLDFPQAYIMKLQVISENLDKTFVANLKWQHQRTIDFFFISM